MGLVLGFIFIVVFCIGLLCLIRALKILKEFPQWKSKILSVSAALSLIVLGGYFYFLKEAGRYNPFSTYIEVTLFYIAAPALPAIILTFFTYPRVRVTGAVLALSSALTFLIVNLWAFFGPRLSSFGIHQFN